VNLSNSNLFHYTELVFFVSFRIDQAFDEMKIGLKKTLSEIDYVGATADCWSSSNRAYLGVTVHWLDENLIRKSQALACKRIVGSHTFDVLAEALESVLQEFQVLSKTRGVCTDNGSNFVKAFKIFSDKDQESEEREGEDLSFVELETVLTPPSVEDSPEQLFHLPKRQQCAVHTLNLVATKDAEKALENKTFKALSRKVFAKCQALWNKQSRSTLAADEIRAKCTKLFSIPIMIRWNSMYKAMDSVRAHILDSKDHLDSLFEALKIPKLHSSEIQFITEYCQVYKPLAQALDILQGEENVHLGFLLPTISILKEKLQQNLQTSKDCGSLIESLLKGLEKRFGHLANDEVLLLASSSHPKFKLSWLKDEDTKRHARRLLINEVEKTKPATSNSTTTTTTSTTTEETNEEDFFSSVMPDCDLSSDIVDQFLSMKDQSLASLKRFPEIEKVFRKFNSVLPSSAPVERLFSIGGSLFRPNRHRMSDEHFEKQLLLKANQRFF